MNRLHHLQVGAAAGITLLLTSFSSFASEAESAAEADEKIALDPVVVVASRIPQSRSQTAAQVTVIDAADIRRSLSEDLDGILQYQPGLELETSGTRFAPSGVNIRGIGGNRVEFEVDGVPARDQFIIGAYSNGGRLLVETDRIKRAEVLPGPASVMYGSNALGGVIAISTWNPEDLLADATGPASLGLRAGYQGRNDSWVGSGIAAWAESGHGLLAAATWREGHEMDNQAPPGTAADPQDWDSSDYMFRYSWTSEGGNLLRLTADRVDRDAVTQIESLLGYGRRFRWTTAMTGDDHDQNRRLVLDYQFSIGAATRGELLAFDTRHDTDQRTHETRAIAPVPVSIDRRFQYSQDQAGARAFLFHDTAWGDSHHRLGAGGEWSRSDIDELRDGLQTSLVDGSSSNVILGEEMPVRDFPVSRTDAAALWLEDEISLADGRWVVTPALRWDRSDLKPKPDGIWREDNPDTGTVAVSESQVTPRLGILFHAGERWSLYGQYSEGFRAPPFEDANIGFDVPLFGFRAIPNPDLESETSQGVEFGVRQLGPASHFSLALFYSDYDNFIESRALVGRDPDSGDLIFQSRNLDRARIYGADLRYDRDLSGWNGRLDGWSVHLAAYWARGEDRSSGMPLNSIAPPQAVAGLRWQSADTAWDAAATLTVTAAKQADDIDMSNEERFATPAWSTIDLTAGWRPSRQIELRAGVFNLGNETYWRWLDVANLDAANPMIPLLTRPGRSYSISMSLNY